MTTAARHQQTSARLLAQANQAFRKGHLTQAADKAWEAVAQYVNSVAKARGWPDESHRDLRSNARKLLQLIPDTDDNMTKLSHVYVIHLNYFDDHVYADDIELVVRDARTLVNAMREAEQKMEADSREER